MNYRKSGNPEDGMVYKKYKNKLNILVEADRRHYESNLNEYKSILKKNHGVF